MEFSLQADTRGQAKSLNSEPPYILKQDVLVGFLSASLRVQLFLSGTVDLLDSRQVIVMERLVYLLEMLLGLRRSFPFE